MESKTLSVIIPNYNKSIYIKDTIESILNQSYMPNEIIIVDDASTDISKQIIEDYALRYYPFIKAFFFKDNQGVQKARNYGAKKATSEYITFIDSDDFYYDSKKIEKEIKYVAKNTIVYSHYCFYDNNTKMYSFVHNSSIMFNFFKHNQIYCYVNMKHMTYWPFAFIVSKDAFVSVGGYDFPCDYYEDLDILIKYSKIGLKPIFIDRYGMAIRTNAIDISHLSHQRERYNTVKCLIADKYSKDITVKSKIIGGFLDLLQKVRQKIKRLARTK